MLKEKKVAEKDKLDEWQYRIFKWVLFLFFLVAVYRLIDHEIHITQFILSLLARLGF